MGQVILVSARSLDSETRAGGCRVRQRRENSGLNGHTVLGGQGEEHGHQVKGDERGTAPCSPAGKDTRCPLPITRGQRARPCGRLSFSFLVPSGFIRQKNTRVRMSHSCVTGQTHQWTCKRLTAHVGPVNIHGCPLTGPCSASLRRFLLSPSQKR